jgi:hypothetical protein
MLLRALASFSFLNLDSSFYHTVWIGQAGLIVYDTIAIRPAARVRNYLLLRSFVQANVREQPLCRQPSARVEHIAIGDYDAAAVAHQSRVGNHATFADGAQVIDLHLDRSETVGGLAHTYDGKGDRRINEARYRAAVHDALQLEQLPAHLDAQKRAAWLKRIQLDAQVLREVVNLEFFSYCLYSFGCYFHLMFFFPF